LKRRKWVSLRGELKKFVRTKLMLIATILPSLKSKKKGPISIGDEGPSKKNTLLIEPRERVREGDKECLWGSH